MLRQDRKRWRWKMLANDAATTSIIKSVPDTNTKEAILYGSEYIFAKSAKYFWDQVEDSLKKRMAETLTEIQDPDFARFVVNEAPHLLTISNPPLEIDQIKDLRVLSEWIGLRKALYLLEIRRKENDQYARLVGVSEYSQQRGTITETDWKAAILQSNDPLDYESIRAIKDMDAKLSEYESHYAQERMNEYRKYRGMVERELEEESEESSEESDDAAELIDDAEDDGLDAIEIYKEVEIEDDDSEEDDLGELSEDSEDEAEEESDDAAELIDESEESQEPEIESPDVNYTEAEEDILDDVSDDSEEESDDAAELLESEESIEEEETVDDDSEIPESNEEMVTDGLAEEENESEAVNEDLIEEEEIIDEEPVTFESDDEEAVEESVEKEGESDA